MNNLIKLILLFLIISTCAFAQCTNLINEKYSYEDFMNKDFSKLSSEEFNNTCIIGSNFYQENNPDSDIFPDFKNVEFVKCNLDNVLIKKEMIVGETNTKKKMKVQNDLQDWILGIELKPIEPKNKAMFLEKDISIDPKDIPLVKLDIKLLEVAK